MKEFEAAGIKIVTPTRDVPGLFKLAFVEDPWGTRIEVVQDPELLGLHHIHMRAPDPEEVFGWLQAKLGGERSKLKGRIDAHQVQRSRLQRHVDPGAARRLGAKRRTRHRPHRLPLHGAASEDD